MPIALCGVYYGNRRPEPCVRCDGGRAKGACPCTGCQRGAHYTRSTIMAERSAGGIGFRLLPNARRIGG